MVFKFGSDAFQVQFLWVIHIEDAMRISHGDTTDGILLALHFQWIIHDLSICIYRDLSAFQDGFSHIHFHQVPFDTGPNNPGESLYFQLLFLGQPPGVNVTSKATDSVAAHLHLTAVGVVYFHFEVCDLGRTNRQ